MIPRHNHTRKGFVAYPREDKANRGLILTPIIQYGKEGGEIKTDKVRL